MYVGHYKEWLKFMLWPAKKKTCERREDKMIDEEKPQI